MDQLIKAIKKGSKLIIDKEEYIAIAKAFYTAESNIDAWYAKIFFKDHFVLVLSPSDNFTYMGKDIGSLPYDFPTPEQIKYNNEQYIKTAEDYQIVKEIEFGSLAETEGEVRFIDYESESNKNKIISVGLITRTQKRADVIANILELDNILLK